MVRLCLLIAIVAVFSGSSPGPRMVLRQAWPDAQSGLPTAAVSADGRYVAFVSGARLLTADTNTLDDIYVFDRDTRQLILGTISHAGRSSDGTALNPQLSADGRYLTFNSTATALSEAPDRNEENDVFVRDLFSGITRRVSTAAGGQDANGPSTHPALSSDGRRVVFQSTATNLIAGEDANGTGSDVFLADLTAATLTRVGVDSDNRQFARAFSPRISADGGLVVFAATPPPPPTRGPATVTAIASVYIRDVAARTTVCISCDLAMSAGNRRAAFGPDLSADGRIVAFVLQTDQGRSDIVVYDRATLTATTITRNANARSAAPRLSGDGNIVAFESWASNLLCRGRCRDAEIDDNLLPDVYLFERATGRFTRASGGSVTWWTPSLGPAIDSTGQVVVFSSRQPFGPEDLTSDFDLFVCSPVCS